VFGFLSNGKVLLSIDKTIRLEQVTTRPHLRVTADV
jgi:hypothetical protein